MDEPIDTTLQGQERIGSPPMMPYIFKYGLIGVVILATIAIIQRFALDMQDGEMSVGMIVSSIVIPLISIIIYTLLMYFAVNEYKKSNGGFVSLGKAFGVTFLTGLFIAVINFIIGLLIIAIFGFPQGQASELMDMSEPSTLGLIALASAFSLLGGCMVGAFIALIISLVVKKEKPIQFNVN